MTLMILFNKSFTIKQKNSFYSIPHKNFQEFIKKERIIIYNIIIYILESFQFPLLLAYE